MSAATPDFGETARLCLLALEAMGRRIQALESLVTDLVGGNPSGTGGGGVSSAAPVPVAAAEGPAPGATRERAWSPERNAVLRRDWPTGRPTAEIRDELNGLPGRHRENSHIAVRAASLGLKRPANFVFKRPATVGAAVAVPRLPAARQAPAAAIVTDLETVRHWGAQRGLALAGRDIEAINTKRVQLGLPPFKVELPVHLRCAAAQAA